MDLKPEVIRALDREQRVCETALARLREKTRPLEEQYGWSTDAFLKKFDAGEIGDAHAFFLWYALAEAWEGEHYVQLRCIDPHLADKLARALPELQEATD